MIGTPGVPKLNTAVINRRAAVEQAKLASLTPRTTPSIFSPRGTPRVIDWARVGSPRSPAAPAPGSPRLSPVGAAPQGTARAVALQLLEKLEGLSRGEHDYIRRVHVLLRLTLDQAGLGHELDGVAGMSVAGMECLCRRYDVYCTPALAAEVLALYGLPTDRPFPLHDFIARFVRSTELVCFHPKAGPEFPTSPRTPRGVDSKLYATVSGESDEAAQLRARTIRAQSPRHGAARDGPEALARALLVKLEAFRKNTDFTRALMVVLRENSRAPGLDVPPRHASGFPALEAPLLGRAVVRPEGVVAIGAYFGIEVDEAQAVALLEHLGMDPAVPHPLHAFVDRVLNDEASYVIHSRARRPEGADPVEAALMAQELRAQG